MPDGEKGGGGGFTVGRVAGVPIAASGPLLVAAALVAAVATAAVAMRSIGLLAVPAGAVCFVGSFLAHEGAHAVVARRHGLHVSRIVLRIRGGMTVYSPVPLPGPGGRVQIATAGPLASAALATVFAAGALVLGDDGSAHGFFEAFAAINLFVTAVNLLPAPSLDGGQIVGAVWDGWRMRRATRRDEVRSTGAT